MKKLHMRKHAVLSGRVKVYGFQPVKADRCFVATSEGYRRRTASASS
jgi:hypothetical protein